MASLRLTRRGRMVLVLMAMTLLVVAGMTLGRASSQAASQAQRPAHSRSVTVEAGDTLWSVATSVDPHVDPRLVVADIEALNHLSDPTVEPGQALLVPTFG